MEQCSAPRATKAAPPSSRTNSLESLCGNLKSYGIFLWAIKSLLTRWQGGTAAQSRTGIFSWNTSGLTACAGTQSPPAQGEWDIPAPNAPESSNTRHVWRGHSTAFSTPRQEGLPGPFSNPISSPTVPGAVFPLKSCASTDPDLRLRAKAILGWTCPAQRAEGNIVVPRTRNVRFKIILGGGQAWGKDNILKHKTTISTLVLQLLECKAKPWSSASQSVFLWLYQSTW